MNRHGYWHEGDDAAVARYLAEHGSVGQFEGDEFVVTTGREDLLPPWPPDATQTDPERYIDGPDVTPTVRCALCGTAATWRGDEVGWRHEVGLAERGGCLTVWPAG